MTIDVASAARPEAIPDRPMIERSVASASPLGIHSEFRQG